MKQDEQEQELQMIRYFWEKKGDPERYSGWDAKRYRDLWPHLVKAWEDKKDAERRFMLELDNARPVDCGADGGE